MLKELKQRVLEAALEAERSGLCKHGSGNFSALDRIGGHMVISPSGMRREDLTVDDMPVLTLDGALVEAGARGKPSSEYRMHAEIYKLRSDVLSVVHTHSHCAAAFAAAGKPIRPVLFEAAAYGGGEIAVAPYARPGSADLARSIREPLSSADVCLLKNHGLLAVGAGDIMETLRKARYAEDVAMAQLLALRIGDGREPDAIAAEEFERYGEEREKFDFAPKFETCMDGSHPKLIVNLKKLRDNIDRIQSLCAARGVRLAGVVKGFSGIPACTKVFAEAGCQYIGSSRLEQIRDARAYGVEGPFMLIRLPMLGEIDATVRLTEISLNSEISVLRALNAAAARQGKRHSVILMADLGDLREGFWDRGALLEAARIVEGALPHLDLAGVGTNLGCYGSIFPTVEKMNALVECAEMIEADIGRRLDILSGGGSTSLPRIFDGDMPARINQLRVGEAIINARDMQDLFGYDMRFMHQDVFVLQAEVIEVKDKPSHPVGEILYDAFGMKREYADRGVRRRALLALGRVDYAFPDKIYPRDAGVQVIGASSDHTILDIGDAARDIRVGDIVEFTLCYASTAFASHSPNVKIAIV